MSRTGGSCKRTGACAQLRRGCGAGEMSDAAEVLNVVTERLDLTAEGRAMAQAVLGCHIREQMRCLRCGRETRQKAYCQYLFTASASGLREQASVMGHGDEGEQAPIAVRALSPWHLTGCHVVRRLTPYLIATSFLPTLGSL